MKFLRKLLLIFFDLIDELYHQKKIEKFIRKNNFKLNTFIDVGAFRGKYTDLILKMEKNCKIIMLEPQSKYFNFLKNKFGNNNKIEVLRMAVSNKKTSLNLKVNKHEITSTFSKFNETNRYLNLKAILFSSKLENMTKSEEKIETLSLDDIFKKKNIQNIDLIKIDTEGHEYEVLIGARDSIKKIDCILVEFHNDNIYENYNSEKIHNFLIENNFTLLKRFNFPFTTWEDRLYKNSKL
jgi:FkbM family methyltransferase